MSYDAIVIGSRVAGAATAMLLGRRGYRVVVLERATFPSDTISTHIIWQPGVAHLMEWGLSDGIAASNCPPLDKLGFDVGPFMLSAALPPAGPATHAYAPRRKVLDKILADAAVEAGADLREGCSADKILFDDDDRVAGVRGRSKSGGTFAERAAVVIGADGLHSMVAGTLKPEEYNVKPPLTCWYYTYWSGVASDRVRFFSRPGRAIGCIPTNDGLACVPVAWNHDRFHEVKKDVEAHYIASLDMAPPLKEELLNGRRVERFYGTADIPNYFRKPYGPGWALVGDAGYHKDPILAQGISDAFRDASLLTSALDDFFAGRADWDKALAGYESARNNAVEAMYGMNAEFATLEPPPPETQMLLAALRGREEDTSQFFGTFTGAIPVPEFYAPQNIERILAAGQQSQAHNAS